MFGVGAVALSSAPSAAATTATLFVDNVNGGATTGCTTSAPAAQDDPGANAAEALDQHQRHPQRRRFFHHLRRVGDDQPSSGSGPGEGDSLDIEGTGSTLPTLNNGGVGSNITIPTTNAGAITIDHMTISGGNNNTSLSGGGAINDKGSGTLTVGSDTFSGNQAADDGGAIDAADTCVSPDIGAKQSGRAEFHVHQQRVPR